MTQDKDGQTRPPVPGCYICAGEQNPAYEFTPSTYEVGLNQWVHYHYQGKSRLTVGCPAVKAHKDILDKVLE